MKTIKIMLDCFWGPLWCDGNHIDFEDDFSGIEIIDRDNILKELSKKIMDLYVSYYHFDENGVPCWFDEELEKKDKNIMLELLKKINERLDLINDNSFLILDEETKRIQNL